MIIICEKCSKKFNIDNKLIPNSGRLLECGNCEYKWFFKINQKTSFDFINKPPDKDKLKQNDNVLSNVDNEASEIEIPKIHENFKTELSYNQNKIKHKKVESTYILKNTLVFIISFIAFIILFDTFKIHLSKFLPNIISILDNLYLSLSDLKLFIKDLFN